MRITILLLLLSFNVSVGQDLYVADGDYLYAKDVLLFVNNDIRLETATSNLYLRGDAQLLQNNDIKNSDIGELSVYQEQTTAIYEYNFWCSPVGVGVDGTVNANVPFDSSNIHDPADESDLTNVNSTAYLFTTAYDATPTELSSYWLFSMQEAEGYNGWIQIGTTGTVNPGYGFTLKGYPSPPPPASPTPNTLDFRGRPNNGTMTIGVNFDGTDDEPLSEPNDQVSTLAGNPYPSALDLKLLFSNSVNNQTILDGNIYYWEQQAVGSHNLQAYEGGYATYTPGDLSNTLDNGTYAAAVFQTYDADGGANGDNNGTSPNFATNNQRRYAAIGQGFVVNSDIGGSGGDLELNNSMRLYLAEDSSTTGNGSVFRNAEGQDDAVVAMSHNGVDYMSFINDPLVIPEIRIHTHINDLYYRENVIAFRDNSNLEYNKFTDAINRSLLENDTYLLAENTPVIIKSVAFDPTVRIPLGIQAEGNNSSFEISANQIIGLSDDIEIYLFDAEYQTYTDIKDGSFIISLPEGNHDDRFEITFMDSDLLNTVEVNLNDLQVFQNKDRSELNILNPNQLALDQVQLFDINGKMIFSYDLDIRETYVFSTANLSDGVYIVSLGISGGNDLHKKIIITN